MNIRMKNTSESRSLRDILDYIAYAKEKGCSLTGPQDMNVERLEVVG